jgi:peptidoglycan/LPS O-acetylase OafA/YrhL
VHLNAVRGLAAVLVMTSHLRTLFYEPYDHLEPRTGPIAKAFYWTTSGVIAHECVMLFFVLSGYLVGGSVLRAMAAGRWSWGEYLSRRLSRLYTVLVPALILGCLLDQISTHLPLHQQTLEAVGWKIHDLGPQSFLGNLVFLQRILVSEYGSNSPLWSLSYEFWYYMAFPLIVLAISPRNSGAVRLASTAFLAGIMALVGGRVCTYGLIWIAGACINYLPQPAVSAPWWRNGLLCSSATIILGYTFIEKHAPQVLADLTLGIVVVAFIYSLLVPSADRIPELYRTVSQRLSESSYTLYLVHLPFMVLLVVLTKHDRWILSMSSLGYGLGVGLVVFAYAQCVYECFERNTPKVLACMQRIAAFV